MVWIVTRKNYINLDWILAYEVDHFVISPEKAFNDNNAHGNDDERMNCSKDVYLQQK